MSDGAKSGERWRPLQVMDPATTYRHRVPADRLVSAITPNSDVFVLGHFGIARVDKRVWRLHVSGMVDRPVELSFGDLLRYTKVEIESFIHCAGFPDNPAIATRNVSNAVWAGVDLAEVLDSAGVQPDAAYVWSHGPDHGTYRDWRADAYVKDFPIERLRAGRVLLAYEMNGEPLTPAHGSPLRLFVPGYYGTNSVKWLSRIELSDRRAPGLFTTTLYNDPVARGPAGASPATAPVWEVAPEALIVSPAANAKVAAGPIPVRGWAWGAREIAFVDISVDGGGSWHRVAVPRRTQNAWQPFEFAWEQYTPGKYSVRVRATDQDGNTQPAREARNAIHRIEFEVRQP